MKKLGQPSNLILLKRNCRGCPAAFCNYSESARNVTGRGLFFLETGRFNCTPSFAIPEMNQVNKVI